MMTLSIPFLQTRSLWISNTTVATSNWKQNEWKRRTGYQLPYDIYLLLQWTASLSLDLFFYYFLIFFITTIPQDDESLDTIMNLLEEWPLAVKQDLTSSSWLLATHARQVMGMICIGVKVLSVMASFIDTEDPIIKANQVSRSKTYVKKYGISVIDPYTSICGICQIKVSTSTRHCKLCNKCIGGMDHHCKWLNCCIGRANYRIFFILVVSAFVSLVWYSSLALYVVFLCFYRRNVFMVHVIQMLNLTQISNPLETMTKKYYLFMGVACFIAIFSVTALAAMTWLLGFHVRLAFLNMTTIEFISHPMYQSNLYGGGDDDDDDDNDTTDDEYGDDNEKDGYSDDSNFGKEQDLEHETNDKPWRRSWKVNTSGSLKQEGHVMGVLNAWVHKTFRLVGHRYGRLASNDSGESSVGTGVLGFRMDKLLYWFDKFNMMGTRQKQRRRRRRRRRQYRSSTWGQHGGTRRRQRQEDSPTNLQNDINLEELATKTIRPMAITLGSDGPDYDDDMGLDTNILDQGYSAVNNQHDDESNYSNLSNRYLLSPIERRSSAFRSVFSSSSKTTRLVDNSDIEAKMHLSSHSPDTISID